MFQLKGQFEELQKRYGEERKLRIRLEAQIQKMHEVKQGDSDGSSETSRETKRKKKKARKSEELQSQLQISNRFGPLANIEQEQSEIEWEDAPTENITPQIEVPEVNQTKPRQQTREEYPMLVEKRRQPLTQRVITQDDGIKVLVDTQNTQMGSQEATPLEEPTKKERRPPFITLTEKSTYKTVRSALDIQDTPINIRRAVETREGIRLYPETPDDYRAAIKVIDAHKAPRYTYTLPEEQTLKVVFRGIPIEFTEEEILEDLRDIQGFDILSAKRMRRNKNTPYSMMLIQAPKTDKSKELFQVRSIAGMAVRAEPKRRQTGSSQCYRCQNYGHVQSNCTRPFNCVFCAKPHPSSQCDQENGPGKKAKCILCEGPHPAFASSCPKNPANQRQPNGRHNQQRQSYNNAQRSGVSYAAATQP